MKKQDIKKKITEAFISETPNVRDRIIASCEKEEQLFNAPSSESRSSQRKTYCGYRLLPKRLALCALCFILFFSGLSVGLFIPRGGTGASLDNVETFVYLDVNPSIELRMNGEETVVDCIATNEDAGIILSDLKLIGVDLNTALTAIVGSMYVNGYLSSEANSILVSIDSSSDSTTDILLNSITDKINTIFDRSELSCSIIAQSVKVDDALKKKALTNGVSVGKMHLVDKMISGISDLSDSDTSTLLEMSIKELNLIYSTRPEKDNGSDPFEKDVSAGDVSGFVGQTDALELILSAINVDNSKVEWYQAQAKPQNTSEKRQMIYMMSIRFKNNPITYVFELDCQSGEIVKMDINFPEFDFQPGGEQGDGGTKSDAHGGGGESHKDGGKG